MRAQVLIIFSAAAVICGFCRAEPADAVPVRITVRVYTVVEVPGFVLRTAQANAASILRRSGVQLTWVDCTQALAPLREEACAGPLPSNGLTLRILPDPARNFAPNAMGVAFVGPTAAVNASIYYRRVTTYAEIESISVPQALGPVIAHEIVHLLRGDSHHARSGLMRAQWDKNDVQLARVGLLLLTREDRQRMGVRLASRLESVRTP